jgi:hypothetical protein
MAHFTNTIEIWDLNPAQRKALQPGQHITAGGAPGRWVGQTKAGVDVAAWRGNASGHALGATNYFRALRNYAKSRS